MTKPESQRTGGWDIRKKIEKADGGVRTKATRCKAQQKGRKKKRMATRPKEGGCQVPLKKKIGAGLKEYLPGTPGTTHLNSTACGGSENKYSLTGKSIPGDRGESRRK